jgi:prepilin-type N-terminal cleavage/methylation domain-containing protein
MFSNNKGFTLIELLVVVSIIGLLSSIVMASVVDAKMRARDTTRIEQLHQMDLAISLYKADHNGTVPILGSITGPGGPGCSATNQSNKTVCVAKSSGGSAWDSFKNEMFPYIKTLPDSLNGVDYIYLPPASMGLDATDEDYQVSSDSEYDPDTDLGYSSEGYIVELPEPDPSTYYLWLNSRFDLNINCSYRLIKKSEGGIVGDINITTANSDCKNKLVIPYSWLNYLIVPEVKIKNEIRNSSLPQRFDGINDLIFIID